MKKSKDLIIVRGIPGCGKNTFADLFENAVVCTADDFYLEKYGYYNWNVKEIGAAHSWCRNKAENAMKDGHMVIVANTSTSEKELEPYFDMAERHAYRVFSIVVENRHDGKNTHGVPKSTIEKMRARFSIKL